MQHINVLRDTNNRNHFSNKHLHQDLFTDLTFIHTSSGK